MADCLEKKGCSLGEGRGFRAGPIGGKQKGDCYARFF